MRINWKFWKRESKPKFKMMLYGIEMRTTSYGYPYLAFQMKEEVNG